MYIFLKGAGITSKYEALVHEILHTANSTENSSRRFAMLDLRKETHFQSVMELFGGETHVRTALPGLYQRALNARTAPLNESGDGVVDHAVICDLSITKDNSAYSFGLSSLKEPAQEVYSIMSIYIGDTRVGRNVSFEFNCRRAELDCLSSPVSDLREGLRSVLHITWTPIGSNALRSMVLEAEALETVEDPVADAVFEHPVKTNFTPPEPVPLNIPNPPKVEVRPCSKGSKELSYVNVCYRRAPEGGESVNYAYGEARIGQQQRIFLDIRGRFTLKEKCTYLEMKSVSAGLELGSGGSALYVSRVDKDANFTVSESGREITFAFPTDWSAEIPSKKLAGREKSIVDVMIEFLYRDERSENPAEHKDRMAIISASSATSHNPSLEQTKHFVQLDPVKLNWGCVAEDTMIRMACGAERRVRDLRAGDRVYSPVCGNSTVTRIYSGEEPELYVFRAAGGRELRVTADHPVCVGTGGYKAAADITPADQLVLEDGAPADIEALYTVEGDFRVYSLELAEESPVCCNGYQTGDYQLQGKLMCPDIRGEGPGQELLAELEALKNFFR